MPTDRPSPLELLGLLWALDRQLQIASKRMQARIGVTGRQRVAIRLIGNQPGISPRALADELHVDPSTLTGILARLDREDLVRAEPHGEDGRRRVLFLTAGGEAINADASGTVEACVARALAGVPEADVDTAAGVLEAIVAALEAER
jgi:DNA-binding MarR family transcriptional regulator